MCVFPNYGDPCSMMGFRHQKGRDKDPANSYLILFQDPGFFGKTERFRDSVVLSRIVIGMPSLLKILSCFFGIRRCYIRYYTATLSIRQKSYTLLR